MGDILLLMASLLTYETIHMHMYS